MITAFGTVGNVVDAIRAGAENFVQKPWDNEKLLADIRSAIARHKAEAEVIQLKRDAQAALQLRKHHRQDPSPCCASSTPSRRSRPAAPPS